MLRPLRTPLRTMFLAGAHRLWVASTGRHALSLSNKNKLLPREDYHLPEVYQLVARGYEGQTKGVDAKVDSVRVLSRHDESCFFSKRISSTEKSLNSGLLAKVRSVAHCSVL